MASEAMCTEGDTSESLLHPADTIHIPPTEPITPHVISAKLI